MKVWLIQTGEKIPLQNRERKLRTSLLADSLIRRGHSVLWWVSAFDHFKKEWIFHKDTEISIKKGLKIIALKGTGYKKNVSLSRYFDHRIIAWKFKKWADSLQKPNIIVCATPPHDLAYEAVLFAKRNSVPIIIDVRDQWPDIFVNHFSPLFQKFIKLLLYRDFQMIKKVMKKADALVSMMNTLLKWGLDYAGRNSTWKDRVFYLGYKKTNINTKNKSEKSLEIEEFSKDKFVVTFIGTFANYHNPSILLESAKKLRVIKSLAFVIAGEGELFARLRQRSIELPNVLLPGWLNQEEIENLLKHSHIGICPTPFIADFFPNKMFLYLSAGLPVISAFQGDSKEIIEKYQIGFYYPPNDVGALNECIIKLYKDQVLYKRISENAKKIFKEMFDADKIYEEYAEHVERVAKEYKQLC